MATLRTDTRKDGSTAYRVYFRHDGKQTCYTFDDESIAETFRSAVNNLGAGQAIALHQMQRGTRGGGLTVKQWLTRHIDQLTGVEQSTIDKYRGYLKNDIAPMLGKIPLYALTEEDIGAWVQHLETTDSTRGRPRSPKTIKNIHGFLSGALGAAAPRYIPANPAAGRRLPRGLGDELDITDRMLSRDEFDRLLSNVTDYWKPMVEFMVASGCRWGEVSALQPGDVDRKTNTVRIRRAWKYSTAGYTIGPPKTKRSRRTVGISARILDGLDYSNEWLFTNRQGGPVRYAGFRQRVWDPAVKRAGLKPAPTPHALRHTCGSWMLNVGVPVTVVSRHLGHESIQITVDIYGHLDRQSSRAAADAIAKLLD